MDPRRRRPDFGDIGRENWEAILRQEGLDDLAVENSYNLCLSLAQWLQVPPRLVLEEMVALRRELNLARRAVREGSLERVFEPPNAATWQNLPDLMRTHAEVIQHLVRTVAMPYATRSLLLWVHLILSKFLEALTDSYREGTGDDGERLQALFDQSRLTLEYLAKDPDEDETGPPEEPGA